MIQNAISKGVSRLFIPSIDASYTQKMYALEARYPENIFLMMVYIRVCKRNYLEELQHVETELSKRSLLPLAKWYRFIGTKQL